MRNVQLTVPLATHSINHLILYLQLTLTIAPQVLPGCRALPSQLVQEFYKPIWTVFACPVDCGQTMTCRAYPHAPIMSGMDKLA